jgi:endo-alpha-1,4-polygalactosaminidase (GH114 family)
VGLKNSTGLVSSLAGRFDFAVVEQCLQYDECDRYRPFARRGKPIYEVEYEGTPGSVCPRARVAGLNTIVKDVDLTAASRPCPGRG